VEGWEVAQTDKGSRDQAVPRRGHERTAWRTRIKVRVCRCRFMNCTLGDQSSSPCCVVNHTAHPEKEMVNFAQVKPEGWW